jgi:hypothetical protein
VAKYILKNVTNDGNASTWSLVSSFPIRSFRVQLRKLPAVLWEFIHFLKSLNNSLLYVIYKCLTVLAD